MSIAMDTENQVLDETSEVEETIEPEVDIEDLKKKASAYEDQKIRAEKAEKEKKALEAKLAKGQPESADAIDLIKLGKKLQDYSDEELDFVTEHAKSKKPEDVLKALENPFVVSGIQAHREKVEKEKGIKPSGTQTETDKPKSVKETIESKSMSEKEDYLKSLGLYRDYSKKK